MKKARIRYTKQRGGVASCPRTNEASERTSAEVKRKRWKRRVLKGEEKRESRVKHGDGRTGKIKTTHLRIRGKSERVKPTARERDAIVSLEKWKFDDGGACRQRRRGRVLATLIMRVPHEREAKSTSNPLTGKIEKTA